MKKILGILLALCLMLTTASTAAIAESTGSTLIVGEYILDTEVANMNPYVTAGTKSTTLRGLTYDALLYFNPVDGTYVPMLATEWAFNEDYTAITFKLREGVTWHDGEAFDAEDAAFTFNMLKGTTLDTYGLWNKLSSVEATDTYELTMRFVEPFSSFLAYCSNCYIVPEHIWSEQADVSAYLNTEPVGTGAFVFSKYTTGTDLQYTANKDYWAGSPQVDNLVIEMYNSSPNVTLALMAGDVDCTFGTITMSYLPQLLAQDKLVLQMYAGLSNYVVSMNMENELLSDPAVRQAMCMAIDQNSLISRCEYDAVFPINMAWMPDLFGDYVNEAANEVLQYDVEGAKQILEDAGYVLGDDGIYQKDGQRLSFTYYNASGAPAQQMEAGMIQQYLLNIGIEVTPKIATWAELATIRQQGTFDLIQLSYDLIADPYAALFSFFHSSQASPSGEASVGQNYFRYRNEELDALIEKIGVEQDEDAKKEMIYEAQEIIANAYIYLPMYNVGGHNPYYDGIRVTGWSEAYPINFALNLIGVHTVE
ncbi:MAG: ABC transporter substrate-binding protein [Clostridia bacterium]|nr:ABC transporter substrate-binding protein [Clostridia bacterium]